MAYLCNYDILYHKKKGATTFRNKACFSGMYTNVGLGKYRGMHIYVLKDYNIGSYKCKSYDTNDMIFTEDEMFTYSKALMDLGFNFMLDHESEVEFKPEMYKDDIKVPAYKFTIPFEENCHHANLVLINLIRKTHEDCFPKMIRWFLDNLAEKNDNVPILDRLMMATSSTNEYFNEGHTFAKYQRPINIKDHKKLHDHIFANTKEFTNTNIASGVTSKELHTILHDKNLTLTEKHTKYLKLC